VVFRPPAPQSVFIPGPAGKLEAIVEDPLGDSSANPADRFGVVLHPNPQQGGTMSNKVVHTVARTLQELGIPTVRFNFRGVGKSEGSFAEGEGETDDALAVLDWAQQRWPGATPWLGGFSFGGYVALRAAQRHQGNPLGHLITVSPAVHRFGVENVSAPTVPWLLIQGSADEVVDPAAVMAWSRALRPAPRLVVLEGVDHFFHGRLQDLKDAVRAGVVPQ